MVVRRFVGKDGNEKLQLRVDLGLLQLNAEGRPDGKRPHGHPSLLEYFVSKLNQYKDSQNGEDAGFTLNKEDCSRLQMEALQYHHRYVCLLQLEDYPNVIRDTSRNLRLFEFVETYAESEELAWSLQQFRPQVLMIHTRARATQSLQKEDYVSAIDEIEQGIEKLEQFYSSHERTEMLERSPEIQSLEKWLTEVKRERPLTRREQLEQDLDEAVQRV